MFHGVVHANARKVLASYVRSLPDHVHVICSGNFSIETTLRMNGYTGAITGCDVSTYTCMLGAYLAGQDLPLVMDFEEYPDLSQLAAHLGDQEGRAAAVAVALDAMQFIGRKNRFQNRTMDAYVRKLDELVEGTRVRLRKKREEVKLDAFFSQCGMSRIESIPASPGHALISFPPTYSGDYERLYRGIDKLCIWEKPEYAAIDGLVDFARKYVGRDGPWVFGCEIPTPEVEEVVGKPVSWTPRGAQKSICLYSNIPSLKSEVVRRQVSLTPTPYPRFSDEDTISETSKLEVFPITSGEANYIRAIYIALTAVQCDGMYNFAVTVDGKIIGILIFQLSNKQQKFDSQSVDCNEVMYMTADTAISSRKYNRLGKLVLMASLSAEVKHELERRTIQPCNWIMTTAFSRHQESMKYRGVYRLQKRMADPDKEGITKLNYAANPGQYTLQEALSVWLKKHNKTKSPA